MARHKDRTHNALRILKCLDLKVIEVYMDLRRANPLTRSAGDEPTPYDAVLWECAQDLVQEWRKGQSLNSSLEEIEIEYPEGRD